MDGVTKLWTRSKVFQTVKSVKTYREGVRKGQIEEDKRGFHWGRGWTIAKRPGLMEDTQHAAEGLSILCWKVQGQTHSLPQKDLS